MNVNKLLDRIKKKTKKPWYEIAHNIGISKFTICRWRKGHNEPSYATLKLVKEYLSEL